MREFLITLDLSKISNPAQTESQVSEYGSDVSSVVLGALLKWGDGVVSIKEEEWNDWKQEEPYLRTYYEREGM